MTVQRQFPRTGFSAADENRIHQRRLTAAFQTSRPIRISFSGIFGPSRIEIRGMIDFQNQTEPLRSAWRLKRNFHDILRSRPGHPVGQRLFFRRHQNPRRIGDVALMRPSGKGLNPAIPLIGKPPFLCRFPGNINRLQVIFLFILNPCRDLRRILYQSGKPVYPLLSRLNAKNIIRVLLRSRPMTYSRHIRQYQTTSTNRIFSIFPHLSSSLSPSMLLFSNINIQKKRLTPLRL